MGKSRIGCFLLKQKQLGLSATTAPAFTLLERGVMPIFGATWNQGVDSDSGTDIEVEIETDVELDVEAEVEADIDEVSVRYR